MAKTLFHKPRCSSCEYYGVHNESVPKKVAGAFLRVGCRYCSGGKRIRVFKRSDPKVYIPSWCPRRKEPAELRVYCYKDTDAWFLSFLFEQDGTHRSPHGYEYAVRHECSTELTAKGFYESTEHKLISDVLGFPVQTNEVIKIDDGLRPYYFSSVNMALNFLPILTGTVRAKTSWTGLTWRNRIQIIVVDKPL